MRCWPSSERTTNPSSRRKRQDSLSLSLVLFPPKPLRWVSAGTLLGAVIKTPVLYFLHFCVGGITYPPVAVAVSEQPGAGFISAEKTAFSEWVLCADECAVPSCTQRFFGVPAWGWYHYPRHAIHAVETLDARGSRRRIYRFYAVPEFALCGLNLPSAGTHATPAPNRAHSGSHAETRAFRTGGGITTLGAFCAVRKPCVARCQNGVLCRFWGLVVGAPKERREPAEQRCAYARRCSKASRPRWAA